MPESEATKVMKLRATNQNIATFQPAASSKRDVRDGPPLSLCSLRVFLHVEDVEDQRNFVTR